MNKMMSSSVIEQTSSLSISSQNMLASSNAPIVDFSVGSMPANYGYDESFSKEDDEDDSNEESSQFKPRILIMGLRKSGKTSIKNVVFHKMEPNETLFLDPTTKTNLEDISCCSFITFQVYDCSGQIDLFSDPTCDYNALLKGCGSLIFVIDAQDEDQYLDAISCLAQTIFRGYVINRAIKFEVFIHKVDGFPDEKKMEIYNEIQQRATEMLIQQDSTETLIQKIYLK
ncbi:ras-related GTP-binding C [Brachionus plicatilis]|nr:ras-related GTP-binding C [Brachionus plicatilis]